MTVKTIYTNADNQATIVCEHCSKTKSVPAANFREIFKPLKVRCGCGTTFFIRIEIRKFYRKKTRLNGEYTRLNANSSAFAEKGHILVEDLSRTGIGFCTTSPHTLQVDKVVVVQFTLDDSQRTHIRKNATVRRVSEYTIGAEFLDFTSYCAENRTLGFYLMPK